MWWYIAYLAAKTVMGTNEEIKAAKEQNKTAMSQLGKEINQINLQRAQSQRQTAQALFNIDKASASAQSQVQLQAASSGTMGASVKDAVSTVNIAFDRQESSVYQQQDAQMEQYRLATQRAVDNTYNQMDWQSGRDKLWNQVMSAAGQGMGSMAGNAASSMGGSGSAAGVSSAAGSDSISSAGSNNYGYDLWGRQAGSSASSTSWKSYLNN